MAYRVPYLEVNGPTGTNLVPVWGSKLKGVKIVSYLDHVMDEATITFANPPPYFVSPPNNTQFSIRLGWSQAGAVDKGIFFLQRVHLSGSPEQGERVSYICRASAFDNGLNKVSSQHFGADNGNTTLGDVFKNLFKDTGKTVDIAPEIAGKPLPDGYYLQWNQTALDAAQDLAQNNRAVVKIAGDKIIVLPLDQGVSVSGSALGGITINHADCYEYDCEIEPRFRYASVAVPWFDPTSGKTKVESSPSAAGGGDVGGLPHLAAGQYDAQALADAHAAELGREEFTGLFVVVGSPTATAGATVATSGFPDPIDGAKLQCMTLTDEVSAETGWRTTIEVQQIPT